MKFSELKNRFKEEAVNEIILCAECEDISKELAARGLLNPFVYASWCERNFELNLREDYGRKTTFTHDFSIAEICVPKKGMRAIADTLLSFVSLCYRDYEYFAELIIVLNLKAWEHYARKNYKYSEVYSKLYLAVKNLYFDCYNDDDKAVKYYFDYVD